MASTVRSKADNLMRSSILYGRYCLVQGGCSDADPHYYVLYIVRSKGDILMRILITMYYILSVPRGYSDADPHYYVLYIVRSKGIFRCGSSLLCTIYCPFQGDILMRILITMYYILSVPRGYSDADPPYCIIYIFPSKQGGYSDEVLLIV